MHNFLQCVMVPEWRADSIPPISVVLFCLISVGLLSTALVSGMLSVSSATLAAAGAISEKKAGDPSRNLLVCVFYNYVDIQLDS